MFVLNLTAQMNTVLLELDVWTYERILVMKDGSLVKDAEVIQLLIEADASSPDQHSDGEESNSIPGNR